MNKIKKAVEKGSIPDLREALKSRRRHKGNKLAEDLLRVWGEHQEDNYLEFSKEEHEIHYQMLVFITSLIKDTDGEEDDYIDYDVWNFQLAYILDDPRVDKLFCEGDQKYSGEIVTPNLEELINWAAIKTIRAYSNEPDFWEINWEKQSMGKKKYQFIINPCKYHSDYCEIDPEFPNSVAYYRDRIKGTIKLLQEKFPNESIYVPRILRYLKH